MLAPIVVFAIAAVFGLTLAMERFRGQLPKMPIALAHGGIAATGLVVLGFTLRGYGFPGLGKAALVVFVIAALGGLMLFSLHLRKRQLPIPVVVAHALGAITAFVLLIVAAL